MWYRLMGILVIGTLLSLPIGQRAAQGNAPITASDAQEAMLSTQVQQMMSEGDASDIVPVIVTLKSPYGLESTIQPRSSIALRRAQIRNIQDDFVGRQGVRIANVKRKSNVFPIVYMSMVRSDIAQLAMDNQVAMIVIDRPVPPSMFASTELIGSRVANDSGYDGTGTSVAVLDTGVHATHPFLSGKVVEDACFSTTNAGSSSTSFCPGEVGFSTAVGSGGPCPSGVDGCDHGTHVAGTVAGNELTVSTLYHGSRTIRGVAPGANIIAVQVFSRFPASECGDGAVDPCALSFTSDQDAALEWLYDTVSAGAPADWGDLASVNMSLGGGKYATTCDVGYSTKWYIDQLRTIGVATVIASGNDGYSDGIGGPACISSAIAVGASTNSYNLTVDQVTSFSNAPTSANNGVNGNGDRLIDLLAPGQWVYSGLAHPGTTYDYYAGTSMATPHVAGAWAVMKQAAPTASVAQILQWLYATGTSITDTRNSLVLPRINVDDAVALGIVELTTTPTPTTASTATSTSTPTRTFTRTVTRTVTPIPKPGAFNKSAPANNLTNRPLTLTLSWTASSAATSYEYCLANTAAACTNWKSVGTARTVTIRSLLRNKDYFWNVRAKNSTGSTLSNGGIWKFKTIR